MKCLKENKLYTWKKSLLCHKSFQSNFSIYTILQLKCKNEVTWVYEPYPVLIIVTMIGKIFVWLLLGGKKALLLNRLYLEHRNDFRSKSLGRADSMSSGEKALTLGLFVLTTGHLKYHGADKLGSWQYCEGLFQLTCNFCGSLKCLWQFVHITCTFNSCLWIQSKSCTFN